MEKFITTSMGTFTIVPNQKTTTLYINNVKVVECEAYWWDKDALISVINENHDKIKEKLSVESAKKSSISENNVETILIDLIEYFGKAEKGFYSSRIKQCLNKLKEAKQ